MKVVTTYRNIIDAIDEQIREAAVAGESVERIELSPEEFESLGEEVDSMLVEVEEFKENMGMNEDELPEEFSAAVAVYKGIPILLTTAKPH
jgi:hypothetical protein